MTIFELVKIALDALYAECRTEYGGKVDNKIRKRLGYLTDSYGQLTSTSREPVSYRDPATRFAYVYKYVAAHGDYVVQILRKLRGHLESNIFPDKIARVSCVGGGPGSDIIAVLKYLDDFKDDEVVTKVTCYLLDREQAWADTWTELDDSLQAKVALHANFQPLDVTRPESWLSQRKFLQADVFTLSYFVSEVRSLDQNGAVSAFWKSLFESAKPGALVVYVDNGNDDFNSYFDEQWKSAGMSRVIAEDNVRMIPRFSEQASELGEYLEKFDQSPKIQALLSYRVLRKR
jgi:ribosomal protein RSM22 (predicted rRNA methylase)